MRDVGAIVWVVLVVIGVVSSIVSNARRRVSVAPRAVPQRPSPPGAMAQRLPPEAPAPPPPVAQVTRVRPPSPPPRPVPQPERGLEAFRPARPRTPRLFAGRGAIVRAVMAAEILGKPLALRDWP